MTAAVVAVVLLAIVTIAGRNGDAKAPFSAKSVAPTIELQIVPAASAQQRLDALAGSGRLVATPTTSPTVIVGQLHFSTPCGIIHGGGVYALVFVDSASRRPLEHVIGVAPSGAIVRAEWDSRYNVLATSHSLFAAGATGSAVSFTPSADSPITFEALPPAGSSFSDPRSQLSVALAFFSANGHLYWVDKLSV